MQYACHHLTPEQIRFLNRGPTYVVPCQLRTASTPATLRETLIKQMAPLRRDLTQLFTKYPVDLARRHIFQRDIDQQFISSFSRPIVPAAIARRVFREKQLVRSIQWQLHTDPLILRRTADETNSYYLGYREDFDRMARDYMETRYNYERIGTVDELNSEQSHVARIVHSIDSTLEQLARKKLIPSEHLSQLQVGKKIKVQLPSLYFLPDIVGGEQVLLRPRLTSCRYSPVQSLVRFLDQLLRPLYENFAQATTLLDGHDFLQKLQYYCGQAGGLTANTRFFTFQMHNIYTRVAHADLLTALNRFLVHQLVTHRHQRLTIDTIEELTALVLGHHLFTYQGNIYRYRKGSPLNYAFTQLLVDIYLQNWQIPLVRQIRTADKFYGRYHDTGIFTWNGPTDAIEVCLGELSEQHPDIQLTTSVRSHVHFLHAYVENQRGSLYTRVYHDPTMQPFLLPYAADHPRLIHRQWFRFALVRAGQYCGTLADFLEERVRIELTFLANGYSPDFVQYHMQQFYQRFSPRHRLLVLDRMSYASLRHRLFSHFAQKKLDWKQQQQLTANLRRPIPLHYLFDWGARCEFNRKFHELWLSVLMKDPAFAKFGLQVLLRSKHCYSSNTLLAHY